jgi:dynein heavy chain 1
MEGPLAPGAANGSIRSPSPAPPAFDPNTIVEHLEKVLDVSLGATHHDLYAPGSLLSAARKEDTLQRCSRFASEGQHALYLVKNRVEEPRIDGTDGTNGRCSSNAERATGLTLAGVTEHFTYTISSELTASPSCAAFVVISKRPIPLDPAIPLNAQVHISTLPGFIFSNNAASQDGTPYEFLQSHIQSTVEPYFDNYTKSQRTSTSAYSKGDNDARTGISAAKKKMAELALSFGHLQQNAEIPELLLPLHPLIQIALEDAENRGQKPSPEQIPSQTLQDSSFLNGLQATVNGWIKSIQTITKTSRDVSTGTAGQEINFWLSMENRLQDIERQLGSPGVRLTLDVLKNAKRFQATVSFSADTGLKESTDLVQKYNQLMREFPLDQLLSATSLQAVQEAINSIFGHMNKKLRICPYPVRRALPLVEAISGDLNEKIHKLLHGKTLMHMDYPEFQAIMAVAESIWKTWEENVKEFTNVAREVTRRRNEKFIPIKISAKHKETEERIRYITTFRKNHEQLQRTIVNVLGSQSSFSDGSHGKETVIIEEIGDVDAVKEVKEAYDVLKDVDVLDVSAEGTRLFEQAEQKYNERTSRVENSIIARLRDRLGTAKTASEMFRVFAKFNPLFVRPKIRGAISEYQSQLIENVRTFQRFMSVSSASMETLRRMRWRSFEISPPFPAQSSGLDRSRRSSRTTCVKSKIFSARTGHSIQKVRSSKPRAVCSRRSSTPVRSSSRGYRKLHVGSFPSQDDSSSSARTVQLATSWNSMSTSMDKSLRSSRRCATLLGVATRFLTALTTSRKRLSACTRTLSVLWRVCVPTLKLSAPSQS